MILINSQKNMVGYGKLMQLNINQLEYVTSTELHYLNSSLYNSIFIKLLFIVLNSNILINLISKRKDVY